MMEVIVQVNCTRIEGYTVFSDLRSTTPHKFQTHESLIQAGRAFFDRSFRITRTSIAPSRYFFGIIMNYVHKRIYIFYVCTCYLSKFAGKVGNCKRAAMPNSISGGKYKL